MICLLLSNIDEPHIDEQRPNIAIHAKLLQPRSSTCKIPEVSSKKRHDVVRQLESLSLPLTDYKIRVKDFFFSNETGKEIIVLSKKHIFRDENLDYVPAQKARWLTRRDHTERSDANSVKNFLLYARVFPHNRFCAQILSRPPREDSIHFSPRY